MHLILTQLLIIAVAGWCALYSVENMCRTPQDSFVQDLDLDSHRAFIFFAHEGCLYACIFLLSIQDLSWEKIELSFASC